ncbi:hypothetical protein ACIPW5_00475 [Streptomyces sp. NPDC090077]|uniref:hypothetical protein n=1 Tax=Streptomyces sp. NPDC090077 TaxID=3365938 RepID=UPI00380D5C25
MNRKSAVLTAAGVVSALALAAIVATPAIADWRENRHVQSGTYATGALAKAERASVPRWLPDGATAVSYAMKTTGGERLLKAALPGGGLPEGCRPLDGAAAKEPGMKADWFPEGARNRATARCGLYYAHLDGSTLYAWQDNTDWIDAGAP